MLVTGAARGNGRAIAEGFARRGAAVFAVDKSSAVMDRDASLAAEAWHGQIIDVTEHDQMAEFLAQEQAFDVVVVNAGITLGFSNETAYWNDTLGVNLTASYHLMLNAAEKMKSNGGGSMIVITSISAHLGSKGNPAYHASKGGLRFLAKGLAADLGPFRIRVNSICPGYIRTHMTAKSHADSARHEMIRERTMLGRWGESEDLVGACIFLASDAAAYITGADLFVDGGLVHKGV